MRFLPALIVSFLALTSPLSAADPLDSLALVYDDGMGHALPYRLFLPPGYDEPGASFPLVLFLHGAGERGSDNLIQVSRHIDGLIDATQSDRFASFLLAPQAPTGGSWSNFGSYDQLNPSTQLVTEIIAQLETQYQIDPTRRYVTGLSMGGYGTFDLIAKRPDMFARAMPLSGGGDPGRAADMAGVPLWVEHGHYDDTVDPMLSRNVVQALTDIGADPIYLEDRGSHEIWDDIYNDPFDEYYPWLFEGTPPPLGTMIYNAATGDVRLDATVAPDGVIDVFRIRTRDTLNLTGDIEINGVTVVQVSGSYLIYDGRDSGGFTGVVDLGNILPPGLDLNSLAEGFYDFFYRSPATGTANRNFRFRIVVPEPSTLGLLVATVPTVFWVRRRRGNVLR